jgi:dihydroxyacid dehydratase/phosphogluconate dehydratase
MGNPGFSRDLSERARVQGSMDAKTNIRKRFPGRHLTEDRSLENAAAVIVAMSGSTNAALHLAIAHTEIFKKTPYAAGLKPGGRDVAKDMFEVGGIPLLTKTSLDCDHLSAGVGSLNVKLTGAELAERKTKCKARETNHTSGALWKYARQVGLAVDGAVIHPGRAHEKQCYADI